MEFYLTEVEQDLLGRDLHTLEVLGPRVADMLVPSTPASGTNAGRPAKRSGSRPPVVVHVLDVKIDAGVVLAKLVTRLVMTVGRAEVGAPGTNEIAGMAAWLHRHVLVIAAQPWARERALEVARVARRVADLVDPPPPVDAPSPPRALGPHPPPDQSPSPSGACSPGQPGRGAVAEGEGVHGVRWERAGFAFGSSRQVEEAARLLGEPVSRTTIRKWAREGHVVAHLQDDGTQLYSLAEVLDYARRWRLQLDEASS